MNIKYQFSKFLYKYRSVIVNSIMAIIAFFAIALCMILFKDISNNKDVTQYCYAFFVANAVAANCLFSIGRSNVFLERFPEKKPQLFVYKSGANFLQATILALCVAAFSYFQLSAVFSSYNSEWVKTISLIIISIFLFVGIGCSLFGLIYFFRWQLIASERNNDDAENSEKEAA